MAARDISDMVRDAKGRFLKEIKAEGPVQRGALTAREMLRRQTANGYDRHGKQMASYAQSTLRKKRSRGQQTSPVNLRDQQIMLGSALRVEKQSSRRYQQRYIVFIDNADRAKVADYHSTGTRHMPRRDFWGLTPRNQDSLFRQMGVDYGKRLIRSGGEKSTQRMYIRM